jgi:AraC-like DNA-binding protein
MALHYVRPEIVQLASDRLSPYRVLPEPYTARILGGWDEVFELAPEMPPSSIVVIDCTPADRAPGLGRMWELLTAFPSISVVAAVPLLATPPALTRELLDHGISEFLDLDLDCSPVLAIRRFREARGRPFTRRVDASLSRYVSADGTTLIRAAAQVAVAGGNAAELAEVFGVTAETVGSWCADAGLPPPRTLQAWMRLLLAATLLEERGRSVASIARHCGYSSDRSLRRALNKFVGTDARSARQGSTFEAVATEFNSALFAAREAGRDRSVR